MCPLTMERRVGVDTRRADLQSAKRREREEMGE